MSTMAGRHKLKVVLLGEGAWATLLVCAATVLQAEPCVLRHLSVCHVGRAGGTAAQPVFLPGDSVCSHTSTCCTTVRGSPCLCGLYVGCCVFTHVTRCGMVAVVAPGRVGKTSIVLRFVRNEYDDRQASTLQASYLDKNITLGTQVSRLWRALSFGGDSRRRLLEGCTNRVVCWCHPPATEREIVDLGHCWPGTVPCAWASVLPRCQRGIACV